MSQNVTFEEDNVSSRRYASKNASGLTTWVVTHSGGFIKNEKQAAIVLVLFIVLSFFIIFKLISSQAGDAATVEARPGYEVVTPQNAPPRLVPIK